MAEKDNKNKKPDMQVLTADAGHDLYEQFMGDVVPNPDQVVQKESNGQGLKVYEEMEAKDGHIRTVLQTRKLSVTGKEWIVEPASDDAEDMRRAEFVERNFKNINFSKAVKGQLDGLMKGFSVSEIIWGVSEGNVVVSDFRHRKPWRFSWGKSGELKMLTEANPIEGEEVPRQKFWVFIHDQKYESRHGRPLGETLFWPYWFKKSDIKWWLIFNEKFGSPTAVGKYPPNTPKEKQDLLMEAVKAIQQDTAVTIPEGMMIELLEAERRGSMDTYKAFVEWAEALQSKIVLGQTLTTQQGDTGAMALGQVHDKVRGEMVKADCDDLCESLNTDVIPQLVDFNFPPSKNGYPKLWFRTEAEKDLESLARRDSLITAMGFELTEDYIRNTYDVDVKARAVSGEASGAATFADSSPLGQITSEQDDEDDPVGRFVERAMTSATHDPLVDPILKILNESKDLMEFKDRLLSAYSDMDVLAFGDLMQNALQVAELTGRWEALSPAKKEDR